ncbi:MAG: hypothetical protein CBD38_01090 [bacterium TMED178]|nr:MAG: hypothetical protein CBD38_01090 [bacterium TMED178]
MEIIPVVYYTIWPIVFCFIIATLFLLYTEKIQTPNYRFWIQYLFWINLVVLVIWPITYFAYGNWWVAFGMLLIMLSLSIAILVLMGLSSAKRKWWYFSFYSVYVLWTAFCVYFSLYDNVY